MKDTQRSRVLETILVLVLASGIGYWHYKKPLFLFMALVTGVTGLFVPVAGKAIHWVWMKLAAGLGFVMSKIVLTLIFIVVVIPLGWITRKAGRSSIKSVLHGTSSYKERNHIYMPDDLENLW